MSKDIPLKGFGEYDALTGWRRAYNWRLGQRAQVKATYNRRVRRVIKRRVRERDDQW